MVTLSLLTTIALTIFMIESYLPPFLPIPGIKLGLSNIVTLLVILLWGFKEGAFIIFYENNSWKYICRTNDVFLFIVYLEEFYVF